MSFKPLLDFDEFWDYSTERANAYNDLCYHPCCDVWTTRNSKRARNSHRQQTRWRALLSSLDPRQPDKKQALHAKMIEEGWSIPVLLNDICREQLPRRPPAQASAFKHHVPGSPKQPSGATNGQESPLHPPWVLPSPQTPLEEVKEGSNQLLDTVSLKSFSLPGYSSSSSLDQ